MFTHKAKNATGSGYTDIPLQLMKEEHLQNTVALWLTKLQEAKKTMEMAGNVKRDINFVAMQFDPKAMVRQAEDTILKANEVLPFYLYECAIRGITTTKLGNTTEVLQAIFERKGEIQQLADAKALELYQEQEYEEDEDEPEVIF